MKTHHYVTLLLTMGIYFSNSPFAFSQNFNWIKQISGTGVDYLTGMTTDTNGNIYVVGGFAGTIDFDPGPGVSSAGPAYGSDIWFGKYSSSGNLIWAHALIGGDDDFGTDIALDNSGNVYITGYFGTQTSLDFNPGAGTANPTVSHGLFLAKYNNSGVFQWVRTIGHNNVITRSQAIEVDGSGNCYIAGTLWTSQSTQVNFNPAGSANLNTANGSVFYAKYSSSGAYVWAKNVGPGNSTSVECDDLALDASSNVYITGSFSGTADFHPSGTTPTLNSTNGAAYICKYNSSGNYVWTKQVNGQNGDRGRAATVDNSGNVYVAGGYNTGNVNAFLVKFNSSGTQLTLKNIGGSTYDDRGQSLRLDGSSIYMAGRFRGTNIDFNPNGLSGPKTLTSSASYADFFLAKYSTSNLDCQWASKMDLQLDALDPEANGLAFSNGKVVAAGNFKGSGDFNACASSTMYSASTLDAFLVGFDPTTVPLDVVGPAVTCSSGDFTYTVTNPPAGLTINWSITPSANFNPSSGTGTSFSTNSVGGFSGAATVTASVAGTCPNSGHLSFWAGTRAPTALIIVIVDPWMRRILAQVQNVPGATGYEWYINGVLYTGPGMNNDYVAMPISGSCSIPGYTVGVKAINTCGTSTMYSEYHANPCYEGGFLYSYYPNPASETLILESNSPYLTESTEVTPLVDGESQPANYYRLHDFNTNQVVLEGSFSDKAEIDVTILSPGRYILRIQTGKDEEETHHILIEQKSKGK
jgi:hypothetical protein